MVKNLYDLMGEGAVNLSYQEKPLITEKCVLTATIACYLTSIKKIQKCTKQKRVAATYELTMKVFRKNGHLRRSPLPFNMLIT